MHLGKPNAGAAMPDPNREGGRIGNENGVLCRSTEDNMKVVGYAYGFNSTTYRQYFIWPR